MRPREGTVWDYLIFLKCFGVNAEMVSGLYIVSCIAFVLHIYSIGTWFDS